MTLDFAGLGLPDKLLQALQRIDFNTPTPIQAQAIPVALQGHDILASAQTGTGKTGAFGISLIARMMEDRDSSALILTPTRELAAQINAALLAMIPVPYIKTALLIGGESMPKQLKQLAFRPRLIIGTPGRVNDHLLRGSLNLRNAGFLVLDETDRMLDMGFGVQIDKILQHMPQKRQTLLFSATLPPEIVKLANKYQKNPQRIAVGSTTAPIAKIDQQTVYINDGEKYPKLLEELEAREGSVIIFVKTKHGTQRMADKLAKAGFEADAIHGDLQQRRRDRVIQSFRDRQFRILCATDVAARGLDISHIEHVINYDLPQVPEDYIHRIGRTARAGAEGQAVTFVTNADKVKWNAIQKLLGGKADTGSFTSEPKKSSSARKSFGKKPFGKRDEEGGVENRRFANKKPFVKKTFDKPNEGRFASDDKPFAKKTFDKPRESRFASDDKPFAKRMPRRQDDERRTFDKPEGRGGFAKKPFNKKPFGQKSSESRWSDEGAPAPRVPRPFRSNDDRRSDKPFGERRSFDKKPAGKSDFGKPAFGKAASGKPSFGKPAFGKSKFGAKKPFGGKKFGGGFKSKPGARKAHGE
jgi:ATP-dependent RNA helicase DeaD